MMPHVEYSQTQIDNLPELKINAPAGVYAGGTLEYAISLNGRYVVVLHKSLLSGICEATELLNHVDG